MKHVAPPAGPFDPVRLIAGGGTARERRLLEAAADDVMPPGTPERLEHALAAWAASPEARAGEPVRPAAGARLSRGVMGGLGGLALVTWMLGRGPGAVAPELATPMEPGSVTPVTAAPAPALTPHPAPSAQPSPPTALPREASHAQQTKPLHRTRGAASHEPRPGRAASRAGVMLGERAERAASRGGLLEEARRLDAVHSALDARDGPAARRELAEYRARFPRGDLALEADVLETDVLAMVGELERARALAKALLVRGDAGRYRQRLEQFLQRARTSEGRASLERASGPGGSKRTTTNMDERR